MPLSRKATIVIFAAAAAILASHPSVYAQGRRGPGGFGGSDGVKVRLLNEPKVQDELKLSGEQKQEAQKAIESLRGLFAGLQNATPEERQKRFQEIQDKTKTAAEQASKTLSKEQSDRLEQIALQVRGPQAFSDEKVQAELKFTQDQRQKLGEIAQQVGQQMQALQQGDPEKRAQIMKTAREQALAVLTDEQRQQFEKMQGAKIDLPDNFGFRGPRRQP